MGQLLCSVGEGQLSQVSLAFDIFLLEAAQGRMEFKTFIQHPPWVLVVSAQYCFAGSDPSIVNHNDEHSYYFHFVFLLTYLQK